MKPLEEFLAKNLSASRQDDVTHLYVLMAAHNPGLPFPEYEFESLKQEITAVKASVFNYFDDQLEPLYRRYLGLLSARIILCIDEPKDYAFLYSLVKMYLPQDAPYLTQIPVKSLDDCLDLVIEPLFKEKRTFTHASISAAIDCYSNILWAFTNKLRGSDSAYQAYSEIQHNAVKFLLLVSQLEITEDQYLQTCTNILQHFLGNEERLLKTQDIRNQFLRLLNLKTPHLAKKLQEEMQKMGLAVEALDSLTVCLPKDKSEFTNLAFATVEQSEKLQLYTYALETIDGSELSLEESKIYLALLANIMFYKHTSDVCTKSFISPLVLLSQFIVSPHWQELGLYFLEEELKILTRAGSSDLESQKELDIISMICTHIKFLILNGVDRENLQVCVNRNQEPDADDTNEAILTSRSVKKMVDKILSDKNTQWPLKFAVKNPVISRSIKALIPYLQASFERDKIQIAPPTLSLYFHLHYCVLLTNKERDIFRQGYESLKSTLLHADWGLKIEKVGPIAEDIIAKIMMIDIYAHYLKMLNEALGADTLKFLESYILETRPTSMGEWLCQMNLQSSDFAIKVIKLLFNKHKDNIFNKNSASVFYDIMRLIQKCVTCMENDNQSGAYSKKIINSLENMFNLDLSLEDCKAFLIVSYLDSPLPTDPKVLLKNFADFKKRFLIVDLQVENREQHGRDFDHMINMHNNKLEMLLNVFGPDTFVILSRYLATSALELERFLSNLNINKITYEPLQKLFRNERTNVIDKKMHEVFLSIAQLLSLGVDLMENEKNKQVLYQVMFYILYACDNLQLCHDRIGQYVVEFYLKILGVDSQNIDYRLVCKRVPLPLFRQLLIARMTMRGEFYECIFDKFLLGDLTGALFANASPVKELQQLVKHNENIHHELSEARIDVKKAFAYSHEMKFSYGGIVGGVDTDQAIVSLWASIHQLRKRMIEILADPSTIDNNNNNAKKIIKLVDDFQVPLLKGFKTTGEILLTGFQTKEIFEKLRTKTEGAQQTLVQKLHYNLSKIDLNDGKKHEFTLHIQHAADILRQPLLQETSNAEKLIRKYKFKVKIWDKTSPETFNLGAEVGCCLAPMGGQFPAMVQRRMDDAMFMPVVIDEETNSAVALAWMYFARSKTSKNDIYVVANYFEIAAAYGRKVNLRDVIIEELQEFIATYAKDIGVKGFLMRPLTYGLIPDFIESAKMQICVEKVGGFLSLNGHSDKYYLVSLGLDSFRLFCSKRSENISVSTHASLLHTRDGSSLQKNNAKKFWKPILKLKK